MQISVSTVVGVLVALRKESVDRNQSFTISAHRLDVALRKESVDRNGLGVCHYRDDVSSLSARRAWIEIPRRSGPRRGRDVALRKESVDRNSPGTNIILSTIASLSARRAWIEMIDYVIDYVNDAVALRKESVDRNCRY